MSDAPKLAAIRSHGWVTPLPDGARARCGGPGMCSHCQLEVLVDELRIALATTASLAATASDELTRMTGRAERAESELDDFIIVVADLLTTIATRSWPYIDAAAKTATEVLLRAPRDDVRPTTEAMP